MASNHVNKLRELLYNNAGGSVSYYVDEDGIAQVKLFNFGKNLITGRIMLDLQRIIEELSEWPRGKAVLIYGSGDNFCAGIDPRITIDNLNPAFAQEMSYFMTNVLLSLAKMPLISVCVLTGTTEKMGAEIPLYCDYVVMEKKATISFNHGSVGLTPAWGGANRLCDCVGKKMCMELLLTGKVLTAEEAKNIGIVDCILDSEKPIDEAIQWISTKVRAKASTVQSIKRIHTFDNTPITSYKCVYERNTFALLWSGRTHAKAMKKFLMPSPSTTDDEDFIEITF